MELGKSRRDNQHIVPSLWCDLGNGWFDGA